MKPGLLLIDIQNDYFTGGLMELTNMTQAAENAAKILAVFRKKNLPRFHVQHVAAQPGAPFFRPDTNGVEINESVFPTPGESVIIKQFPNSFRETELFASLKKAAVKDVVICGAMSHMCIDATCRAAFDLGFNCFVIEDACAAKDLEHRGLTVKSDSVHRAFMAALSGTYATVISTDVCLESLFNNLT